MTWDTIRGSHKVGFVCRLGTSRHTYDNKISPLLHWSNSNWHWRWLSNGLIYLISNNIYLNGLYASRIISSAYKHDPQVRNADYSIVYKSIIEGVSLSPQPIRPAPTRHFCLGMSTIFPFGYKFTFNKFFTFQFEHIPCQ